LAVLKVSEGSLSFLLAGIIFKPNEIDVQSEFALSSPEGVSMARHRKFGFSWSWRRAFGLSAAKGRLSRWIGVPLTRSGRQRKLGRIGCCIPLLFLVGCVIALVWAAVTT